MRLAGFEVKVTSPAGEPFHEVVDPKTKEVYIVAAAGKNFQIRCFVLQQRANRGRTYLFKAKIDGKYTGSMEILYDTQTEYASILGFLRQGSAECTTYDLFQFSAAEADQNALANSLVFTAGRFSVNISEVIEDQTRECIPTRTANYLTVSKVSSLPEGKKFFLTPSLKTTSGGVSKREGFSTKTFKKVS
jgi:hypothetical protein